MSLEFSERSKMGLRESLRSFQLSTSKRSDTILMGLGIVGLFLTVYTAHQDTVKAENHMLDYADFPHEDLSPKERLEITWKDYIPTAISFVGTAACIVGSHYCSVKQKEALSSAYLLSQTTLQEYQRRVVERIGESKEREIRAETLKEVSKSHGQLYSDGGLVGEVIDTGHGNTLFYDVPGDRYFKSSITYIKSIVNDLNFEVRTEMYFDWNDIYSRLDLPYMKYGSEMIFDVDHPLDIKFTPELMDDGQVRILIDYDLFPKAVYDRRYQ